MPILRNSCKNLCCSSLQDGPSQDADSLCLDHRVNARAVVAPFKSPSSECGQSSAVGEAEGQRATCSWDVTTNTATLQLPLNVDPDIFKMLPEEIQKELLSPPYLSSPSRTDSPQISQNESFKNAKEASNELETSDRATAVTRGQNFLEGNEPLLHRSSDRGFPGNVDPGVFSELPPDVQRELMSEWEQQKPNLKIPSSVKPGRNCSGKNRKAAGKSSQSNNLFKYFKPS